MAVSRRNRHTAGRLEWEACVPCQQAFWLKKLWAGKGENKLSTSFGSNNLSARSGGSKLSTSFRRGCSHFIVMSEEDQQLEEFVEIEEGTVGVQDPSSLTTPNDEGRRWNMEHVNQWAI
ncbi:hypothetical protein Y032_0097g3019 [Ancylostoma ceylanicum]|uniref:Uncharacterized protein n=1 Tax=Ancylostoma ceylanicum TaxID=53326 RepID=A0A016TK01_9BILA|nr:hypothetical protein Y032_0097g3019 [Ancylostoma ceylanicum]